MEQKTINTFNKGLNQDLAKSVYKEGNYLDALNITLLTDSGLSTAVIQNKKGNKLTIEFPTSIPQANYEATGEYPITVPSQVNFIPIGGIEINNVCFVFTTSNTVNNTNDNGYLQIWRFNFLLNDTIENSTNGTLLNVASHLMYNRYLNIDLRFRPKIVGKYENQNFARLYWSDGNNPLRTINTIGNLSDIIQTPVRTLDIVSEVNLDTPVISKLVTGNLPEGKYQIVYRLLNNNGALTKFSTCSNLIDVIEGDEFNSELNYPQDSTIVFSNIDNNNEESKILISSNKGIEFKISNIDKDYQLIQYGVIYYNEVDIPEIYVFPYKEITSYSSMKDVINELYNETFILNLDDFNLMYSPFEKVKTLDIKENTLFVANTINNKFTVPLDCRAYRFNQSGEATTYELDGTTSTFTSTNYPTDLKLDVINPYNDDSGKIFGLNPSGTTANWFNSYQYKYQSNGITPGGSGPNVSYSFGSSQLVVDTGITNLNNKAPFVKTEVDNSNLIQSVPNHIVNNNGSFSSLKSPYKASCQVSWQRGEVYRMGLVFTNTKGQASYVNWVGDIKMPEFNEFNNPYSTLSNYSSGKLYMYSTTIDFNVTIPENLAKDISGFRVVYVQREESDKTRFGTGVTGGLNGFERYDIANLSKNEIISMITSIVCLTVGRYIDDIDGSDDPFGIKDFIRTKVLTLLALAVGKKLNGSSFPNVKLTNIDDLAELIDSMLDGVTNQKGGFLNGVFSGGTLLKLIPPKTMDKVRETIKEALRTTLAKKVAGLHSNVFSLGQRGFNESYITSPSGNAFLGYTISPAIDFDRYSYKSGDYLKPISIFNQQNKLVSEIHRDSSVGLYNVLDSSAYLRKWYNGTSLNWNQTNDSDSRKINIINQKVLEPGELLGSGFDNLLTGSVGSGSSNIGFVVSNSYISTIPQVDNNGRIMKAENVLGDVIDAITAAFYKLAITVETAKLSTFLNKISRPHSVLGIGDKKHLIISDMVTGNGSVITGSLFPQNNLPDYLIYGDKESYMYPLLQSGFSADNGGAECVRKVDTSGDYIVSYCRNSVNQYGGVSYSSRTNNKYIPASEFYLLKTREGDETLSIKANLGDTYIGAYGAVNYCYYYDQVRPSGYQEPIRTKKGMYEIFPCEADFNFNLREGRHLINDLSLDDLRELSELKVDGNQEMDTSKFLKGAIKLQRNAGKIRSAFVTIATPPLLLFKVATGKPIFFKKRIKDGPDSANDILKSERFLLSDFKYNYVFSQKYNINSYFPKSLLQISDTDEYINRIWNSKKKIDGEAIDSWRDFQFADYIDVEGTQGPIKEILVNKNKLFFYQTNGIGVASVNERGAIPGEDGVIILSNNKILLRYDYITKETGIQHQFGAVNTNQAIYHYDGNLKKLFKFGEGLECISDNLGLFSKLQSTTNQTNQIDTTLQGFGVHGIYEPEYQTVYFTFLNANLPDNNFTLSYNEKLQAFESFFSFKPRLYFRLDTKLFSSDDDNCYWHNKGEYGQFYGEYYPSYVKFLTNENPTQTKVWDNQQFQTEVYDHTNTLLNLETINYIQHTTENQDTGVITLIPQTNINKVERDWKLQIQRDLANATYSTLSKPRLRDLYLQTQVTFSNEDNKRFILHPITTFYRQSTH